ncbi:MAG: protein kinase domain-containing protein [Candidatus Eiseniibacteriota bacterium]
MRLSAGTRLGRYEIVAPIGAGGMGEVYRARDARLDRYVALKALPDEVALQPERIARFEREAKVVAALSHPNIVVLHSIEEEGGVRFLTMELVEGTSLDRLITPGGLPLRQVLDIAVPLADAMAAAHERFVVHRDLKPANVMLTREGRVKVLDFGLAKLDAVETASVETYAATVAPASAAGSLVGTVPYMAPEQLRGESADARTDIFALGILLYELLTGRRPFGGATSAEVSSAILRDPPAPWPSGRPDRPPDLERIVGRCLEKDPNRRIQTARDVRNELEEVQRAVESGGRPSSTAGAVAPSARDVPSIAVLPFVNRSRSEDDEYFADGLADELINMLVKIPGLRVAARSSSFQFKERGEDAATIGRKLNVATLLEGSVRKAGNRVRIAVQVVKVADGFHLWSETYDRTLEDIFAVQDDIALAVVKELRTTLLGEEPDSKASGQAKAEVAAAAKGRGANAEAHRLFLQGRYFVNRATAEEVAKGVELLRQAIAADPGHALAWANLSWALSFQSGFGFAAAEEGMRAARDAARRALELEPDLAEGHWALGLVQHWYEWDWKGAEASYRQALELAPGSADVLRGAGLLAMGLGRLEEGLVLCRRAVEQDPLSVQGLAFFGRVCLLRGLLAEGESAFRRALEISPEGVGQRALLAWALDEQGRHDEALAEALREGADWSRLCTLAILHHKAGRAAESDSALRELAAKRAADAAYQVAEVHAVRGESDSAFEWLERAYAQRDSGVAMAMTDPFLRALHGDPRWMTFLRKMGLVE